MDYLINRSKYAWDGVTKDLGETTERQSDQESEVSSIKSRGISRSTISKPKIKKKTPAVTKKTTVRKNTRAQSGMKLRSGRTKRETEVQRRVTGDTIPKRVTIHECTNKINLLEENHGEVPYDEDISTEEESIDSESKNKEEESVMDELFLSEMTLRSLNEGMERIDVINTMEVIGEDCITISA